MFSTTVLTSNLISALPLRTCFQRTHGFDNGLVYGVRINRIRGTDPELHFGRRGSLADPLLAKDKGDHDIASKTRKGGAATLITLAYVSERFDWGVAAVTAIAGLKVHLTIS